MAGRAAFAFLEEQVRLHGEVLPRELLVKGFLFEGERVPARAPGAGVPYC